MTRQQRLIAILAVGALLAFIAGHFVGKAFADEELVTVHDGVSDGGRVAARIEQRLTPGDEIAVVVAAEEGRQLLGSILSNHSPGSVLFVAIGNDVWVRGNDWVPQALLEERLDRVNNVAHDGVDQVLGMIREVHAWQKQHPRPAPPPPPAQPPPPREPINWMIWGPVIGGSLLAAFLLIQASRRAIKRKRLSEAAEQQIDWDLDDYGINRDLK